MKHLLELHGVAAVLAGLSRVCTLAKLAINDTDIRVIDVAIDVVVREVAVQPFADVIGKTTEFNNVIGPVEFDAFIERKPLAAEHFVANKPHDVGNYT